MMNSDQWKDTIYKLLTEYVERYQEENLPSKIWRTPIVGYADAYDPYILNLPLLINSTHMIPSDCMDNPTVVISYFIPFTQELAKTNVGVSDYAASKEWAEAYKSTNKMMGELNTYLVTQIEKLGGLAAVPTAVGMIKDIIMSNWSQRHLAYAAGLGTFGINNMLISDAGCCGRYNSIVANIPVDPGHHVTQENCLYKSKGICKKCVKNCFSGALTIERFDRHLCYNTCLKNKEKYGADVCGKCDTDIPCAFIAPKIK